MTTLQARATISWVSIGAVAALVLLLAPQAAAAPQHWDGPDGWLYKRTLPVTWPSEGGPFSDQAVAFTLNTATLVSGGKMRSDCGDLRIQRAGIAVAHWVETGCNTASTIVWARFSATTPGTTTEYQLFYGNAAATSVANPNTTFTPNFVTAEAMTCGGVTHSCPIGSHADAHAVRSATPDRCAVQRSKVDYGYVCTSAAPNTDTVAFYAVEYRFLFVPDVTGTWTIGVRGDNHSELVTTTADYALSHSEGLLAANYTDQGAGPERTTTLGMTAGRGIWFDLVASDTGGAEAHTLRFTRPGGSAAIVSSANFPDRIFTRGYPSQMPTIGLLGAELALPSAPTAPAATRGPGIGEITVSWSAPASNGGASVLGYHVQKATSGSGPWTLAANVSGTTAAIGGFGPGETAHFRVSAWTTRGLGAWSGVVSATTFDTPAAPGSFTATRQNHSVHLQWLAGGNGGKALTGYEIYYSPNPAPAALLPFASTSNGANTSFTANTLTNGVTYRFEVAARNSVGEGDRSATASAKPADIPYPPPIIAFSRGDSYIDLFWDPAFANGEPLDDHRIMKIENGMPSVIATTGSGATTSFRVAGLNNGQTYDLFVGAHNAVGWGQLAGPVVARPARAPDAPAITLASPGNASVELEWFLPFDGGDNVIGYDLRQTPAGGFPQTLTLGPATSHVDEALWNGLEYCYEVAAWNPVGRGPWSGPVCATPATAPYPPQAVTVAHGNRSVTLAWSPPADDGGSAVTGYRVEWCVGPCAEFTSSVEVAASPTTIPGLTNGVKYALRVRAGNAMGFGQGDPLSATPSSVPWPPTGVSSARGNATITLDWSAPADEGAPITEYQVLRGPDPSSLAPHSVEGASPFIDEALVNGQTYCYAVIAANLNGPGARSAHTCAVPASLPDPALLAAAVRGDARVDLAWTPGDAQGSPLTSVEVWRSLGAGARIKVDALPGGATTWRDTNVTNGQTYHYDLTQVNALGRSATSNALSAKPATLPSAPRSVGAAFRDGGASVSFLAPLSNGGEPVVEYEVWVGTSAGSLAPVLPRGAGSPIVIGGLVNGQTYLAGVVARNAVGAGPMSSPLSTFIPGRAPDAPLDLVAEAGSRQVRLEWSPPFNGGRAILGYRIFQDGTQVGDIGTNTSYTVNGLTDGTTYTFTVRARNVLGVGPHSASVPAVPTGPPGAPSITFVTTGATGSDIHVAWNAPASNGGVAITHYRVYAAETSASERWLLGTFDASVHVIVDTLPYGVSRVYQVSAVNAKAEGPLSPSAVGSRLPSPLDPLPETYRACERPSSGAVVCTQGARAPVAGLAAGARHTCALLSDGRVDCWGEDSAGQAMDHLGGRPVTAVAAGWTHTCALLDTGDVDCWGANANGKASSRLDGDITAVAAGAAHTCFLRASGAVVCQGANADGQGAPRASGVAALAAGGHHTCFLLADATVQCQGLGPQGATPSGGVSDATAISAGGFHSCALRGDQTVRCWGDLPAPPSAIQGQAVSIASGRSHACSIVAGGAVRCWGMDRDGQSAGYSGSVPATALALGDSHSCALLADGTITCWGANAALDHGQGQAYPLPAGAAADEPDGAPLAAAPSARAIPLDPRRTED